jgi:Predicted acyl esterases
MFDPARVLNLADHTWWWMTYGDGRTERPGLFEAMQQIQPTILSHLPVIDLVDRLWVDLPGWRERLRHGPDAIPPYAITEEDLTQLTTPVLHLGGWHDPFVAHTLRQWLLTGSAITPRPQQTLLVGPWTHTLALNSGTAVGEREYGTAARLPLGRFQVQWLRQVLDDAVTPVLPHVRIFMMGENRWQELPTWPPPTAAYSLFAASAGRLIPTAEALGGADTFTSDPANPFPSRSLPVDQRDLAERPDAIRYTTAPLTTALTWAGTPTVTLYATTDAPGADWVVRLHEILPDGRMLYLGHGLVDAVRASGGTFAPNRMQIYHIPLKPQAITIPAGSRLCLEIASSAFPEYARNLQTGADRYTSAEIRVATQTIHYGEPFPTCLFLPIMPEGGSDG